MTIRFVSALLLASLVVLSCQKEVGEPRLDAISVEEIDAESLWRRISVEAPYSNYSYWPGHDGMRPGQAPHGPYHEIRINRTLLEAMPVEERVAPIGAIIVKKSFNAARSELVAITVMAKVDGFNPSGGDWFWVRYDPDGTALVSGAVEGCIACHAGMSGNDYIIVRPLDFTKDR